jgi:3',5'-cyclic AMP phosphodiesterase CpdA
LRIVHLSDIHVWRYAFNPLHLLNKRALGMLSLLVRRARRFRLERLKDVVARVVSLDAGHILITGDLTTTALPAEFQAAREALADLLVDPRRVTVLPGNHDRYTRRAAQGRNFERWFGAYAPPGSYPWLRFLDEETAVLGLDPARPHLSATGYLPTAQLDAARALIADASSRPRRLIVACHYPIVAPAGYRSDLKHKRLKNAAGLRDWLAGIGPHLFCCGHVHAAWAFVPGDLPEEVCLNAGAPLLRDRSGQCPPGFLEITLDDRDVSVIHHAWTGADWVTRALFDEPSFFPPRPISDPQVRAR